MNGNIFNRMLGKWSWIMGIPFWAMVTLVVIGCASTVELSKGPFFEDSMSSLQCPKGKISLGDPEKKVYEKCGQPIWWRPGPWGWMKNPNQAVYETWIIEHEKKYHQLMFAYGEMVGIWKDNETANLKEIVDGRCQFFGTERICEPPTEGGK